MTHRHPPHDEYEQGIVAVDQVMREIDHLARWIENSHEVVRHFDETMNMLIQAGSLSVASELCDTMKTSRSGFFEDVQPEIDRLVHDFQNQIDEHRTTQSTTRQRQSP